MLMYKTIRSGIQVVIAFLCSLLFHAPLLAQINTPPGATIPFGSNTTYPGTHIMPTNLPSGGTYGASQDAADAYNQWKTDYVASCGGTSPEVFRVKFDTPTETVSEGIAYGMLLSVYAADKALFDGLWQYYKNNSNGNGVLAYGIEPSSCPAILNINDIPILNGTYQVGQEIYSTGTVPANGNVIFKAGNIITLDNDFKVAPTASFDAEIDGCN